MILPTILFSISWVFWIVARNMYFSFRWPVGSMYRGQSRDPLYEPGTSWVKSSLVDMVRTQSRFRLMKLKSYMLHR